MPRIAFWNLNRTNECAPSVELLTAFGVEILIVAERAFPTNDLLRAYQRATDRPLHAPGRIPDISRLTFFSVFPVGRFRDVRDNDYISIKEYSPASGRSLILVSVHLPSKLAMKTEEQIFQAQRVRREIDRAEAACGHDRTVVVGDFNMHPFENGMVASDALHGIMDRRIVEKGGRTVLGEHHAYFYNPMWRLMGDSRNEALGTYFRSSGSHVHYFWHTFDQVLIRPSLLDAFQENELRIIENIGTRSLLSKSGLGPSKEVSDHLPLLFELNTGI